MKDQKEFLWMGWSVWAAIFWGVVIEAAWSAEADTYDLRPHRQAGQIDRVVVKLEVEGKLILSNDPKHPQPKLKVNAENIYEERVLQVDSKTGCPTQSLRYYEKAEATIQIEQETLRPQLHQEHRWIVAQVQQGAVQLFCPKGPLSREELDVVDLMANSVLLDRLLPAEPVDSSSRWEPTKETLAMLLGLDRVSQAEVHCKLSSQSERSILIEMAGSLQGQTGGGQSAMVLKAKYRVDRSTRRINWFGLALAERRTPGAVLRGVDLVAKLTLQMTPLSQSAHLADELIQDVPVEATADRLLLRYEPPGKGWQILHGRLWHVQREENQTAVLALFDQEQLVAQGTISLAAPLPKGQEISLEQFQQEIQQALGKNFGRVLEAGQYPTKENLRMYRVVVEGKVIGQVDNKPIEVPMRWHYYRLSDSEGRQAVFAFSLEPSQQERLGQADRAMVESFRFLSPAEAPLEPSPVASQSEPAKQSQKPATQPK